MNSQTEVANDLSANSPSGSQDAPLFEQFNSHAHKRKTVNVGHPAIVWHQAYWKPKKISENDWHYSIDLYLHKISQRLASLASESGYKTEISGGFLDIFDPSKPLNMEEFSSRYKASDYRPDLSASIFRLRKHGLKLSIVIEKFDEFWSWKTIVDFSTVARPSVLPAWLKPLRESLCQAEHILVTRYNRVHQKRAIYDSNERATLADITSEISFSISKALYDIVQELFPFISEFEGKDSIASCQELFANFVGLSFGINIDHQSFRATRFPARTGVNVIDNIMPNNRFFAKEQSITSNLVEAAWPLVKGINPYFEYVNDIMVSPFSKVIVHDEKREFTISLLNRGRSLYVTSLGGVRYKPDSSAAFPLSYLIISPHRATWQIGRIVDRVHALGLFRLAALREYQDIEKANDQLSKIGDSINKKRIADVSRNFTELTGKGLVNQIEWSRYYLNMFKETVSRLSFKRVEGYQTYEEFISRRLSSRFLTIEDVWNRIDGISKQIRARTATETGNSIRDLLGFAEVASIIPISYYLYNIIDHINDFLLSVTRWRLNVHFEIGWICASVGYAIYVFL